MNVRGDKSGFRRTIPLRRKLRHNLTSAEKVFWRQIANKGFKNLKFRKQHGIGNYIVDFYCSEKKLIIKIDGDTHAGTLASLEDSRRTDYLVALGYKVLRYNNRDVLNNIEGVFEDLDVKINSL
jgi:very-short-patch-repair endonuclease